MKLLTNYNLCLSHLPVWTNYCRFDSSFIVLVFILLCCWTWIGLLMKLFAEQTRLFRKSRNWLQSNGVDYKTNETGHVAYGNAHRVQGRSAYPLWLFTQTTGQVTELTVLVAKLTRLTSSWPNLNTNIYLGVWNSLQNTRYRHWSHNSRCSSQNQQDWSYNPWKWSQNIKDWSQTSTKNFVVISCNK